MPTFIVQGQYSREAIKGFVAKPHDRREVVAKVLEACGATLKEFYVTSGENDFLIILEAPDQESAVSAGLTAAAAGGIAHASTQRAWTGAEFRKMCEKAAAAAPSYKLPGT
ncbi:MAG TPA: GYD domain-containing protein [Thermohalobaculum sp.]|nr:GYD domain-containing protein [Thermohalobaculum sp.]